MKVSLAYRIATMPAISFGSDKSSDEWKIMDESARYAREVIRTSEKVNLQNVWEYILSSAENGRDINAPNLAPPFNNMFFEFQDEYATQFGALVTASEISSIDETVCKQFGIDKENKWILVGYMWISTMQGSIPSRGKPVFLGQFNVQVSSHGRQSNLIFPMFANDAKSAQGHATYSIFITIAMGISFMNCKNVTRLEKREVSSPKAVKRQNAPPFIKYYILDINPMKEVLRTEGHSESIGLKKALHICRGHFATYTAEKPLFGKYVGMFHRPDHVRGSAEKGVVVKDYNVKPE